MSQNPINAPLVRHISDVLYVFVSLKWTWRHQTLHWSAHTTVYWSLILGETCRRLDRVHIWLLTDTDILSMPIWFSQLTVAGLVGCMRWLCRSKTCPASSCLVTVVCIVPVAVNTPGLYAFPGCNFALGRCAIHFHMKSYLTPTSLFKYFWLCHNLIWKYYCP